MASVAPRDLKVGTILDKMFAVIERSLVAALLYFLLIAALNVGLGYYTLGSTAVLTQLGSAGLKFVVGVIAAFFTLNAMLRRTGLISRTDGDVFLAYLVLSIVYILGVMLGMIAIILPGLYIMSRWIVAQPLLLARGGSPMGALAESWERTKDKEFSILLALLTVLVPVIAVTLVSAVSLGRDSLTGMVVSQLASSAGGVLTLAMGVAIYGLMDSRERASA